MDLNPKLLYAARVALGLSRERVAELAGIGLRTLASMERAESSSVETYLKVREAFERLGVVFEARTDLRGPSITLPLTWTDPTIVKPQQRSRLRKSASD